jgi:tetratricopeptide (TPR) repeat protein
MKISSKLYFILLIFTFLFWNRSFSQGNAGGTELKSIEEVIEGIDSLLGDIKNSSSESNSAPLVPTFQQNQGYPQSSRFDNADEQLGSFRVQNELMPNNLLNSNFDSSEPSILEQPLNLDDINPPLSQSPPAPVQQPVQSFSTPPKKIVKPLTNIDYRSASLEELLKEVDLLDLPMMEATLTSPMPSLPGSFEETLSNRPDEKLSQDTVIETPRFSDISEPVQPVEIEDYTVLGERIDHEMKERIREAIMETRRASGGSDNPYVTRSVFKATSYCNRVLGRLNAPHHKRYRRDVLLSLIGMHERNQAWVDAAKSYERYLEEFASDDSYPFEAHEDAPGIPDLKSGLGSVEKWLEGRKRGAPTIPETHIRVGKIYRTLGAHRMALNKFYDAINATLTLPQNPSFDLAEKKKGKALENRMDSESNQAMFEIAETFMDSEDYDNAIKFFDRLWRLEQLGDSDRGSVRFKQGLAHYRRARENLRKEERMNRLAPEKREDAEIKFDQTPRADFAKVKESLRGYGTLYPQSPYVPEAHYLLALTYEQLNQDEESVAELLKLLKEADFNPELVMSMEKSRSMRDRDYIALNKLKGVWNFWKKKTGNYLANKFFEDNEYFNAYRIYSALRDVDDSPSWQVPILYQIALCEEKLGNYVQATETYSSIEEYVNSVQEAREGMAKNKYLSFVFGMAKWRREQLEDTRAIRQAVNRYGIYTVPKKPDPVLSGIDN